MLITDKFRSGRMTPSVNMNSKAVPPEKNSESDTGSVDIVNQQRSSEKGLETFAPHAPNNVKQAWQKASEQTGTNGLGIGENGMMTHIPGVLVLQLEQRQQSGSSDIFGNSVSSAKEAAQKILDRLDNPLIPETNSKIRVYHEKEKDFYRAFVQNLEESSETAAFERWSYRA